MNTGKGMKRGTEDINYKRQILKHSNNAEDSLPFNSHTVKPCSLNQNPTEVLVDNSPGIRGEEVLHFPVGPNGVELSLNLCALALVDNTPVV